MSSPKTLEKFTAPMEVVPYIFLGCTDDERWEIFHMNMHAKRLYSTGANKSKSAEPQPLVFSSMRDFFNTEVLSALRRSPDNVFVLGKSRIDGKWYSIQAQRAHDPQRTEKKSIRWVAIREAQQATSMKDPKRTTEPLLPDIFTSDFCAGDVLCPKLTVDDVCFEGRRVIMRVDYNVPMARDHKTIVNDYRIQSTLPTIRKILADGPRYLVLVSHWGQPKTPQYDEKFSLRPLVRHLQALVGAATSVTFAPDCMDATEILRNAPSKSIILLENLRFAPGENSSSAKTGGKQVKDEMTAKLASYADIYVNDAFGAAHRAAVSIVNLPQKIQISVAGRLLAKELRYLTRFMQNPASPVMAVIGGAKVTDKIKLLRKLLHCVDFLAIGGAMAIPFLKAKGVRVGKSFIEKDPNGKEIAVEIARDLLREVEKRNAAAPGDKKIELLLPIDHAVSPAFRNENPVITDAEQIPDDMMALDIGPKTVAHWRHLLMRAKTILWMGPVGVFEYSNFKDGSVGIARAIGSATETMHAVSVIGGGETVTAVHLAGVGHKMSHVSTGGGATLALLEGQALPGVVHLTTKTQAKL